MVEVTNKYVQRLAKEWKLYGKIIIGVDYDDTIAPWNFSKEELQDTINVVKDAHLFGAYIVIHTACHVDRYEEILSYCNSIGLHVDSINEPPINVPYGHRSKTYANIYLDDRAGLEEAKEILKTARVLCMGSRNIRYDEIG